MAGKTPTGDLLKTALLALLLFLPAIYGDLSWMRPLIPLPAFYILVTTGDRRGSPILTKSILAAGVCSIIVSALPGFILSVSFLPLAYVLARAVQKKESVLKAGITGTIVLTSVWLAGVFVYGMLEQVNPYKQVLETIDSSLVSTYSIYQGSAEIAPETLAQIEMAFNRMRTVIPVIFPAILLITVLCTVWINLMLGDLLIKKKYPGLSSWQPYGQWRLPDQLVWLVIASGVGLMLPSPLINKICLNGVLISGTLYFFQGLAVLSSLFNRWAVPWAFRIFVFTLVVIQAYGIIFLAIAGLIDVWFDLRKSSQNETN